MQRATILLSLLLVFCAAQDESDVLVLSKENFEQTLIDHPIILVEFYAPWCGHCKKLEPAFDAAAKALKGEVALGKVDATIESELATQFGVRGYPTLKFFKNGTPRDYSGPRDAEGIVSWLRKQLGPALTTLTSAEEITEFSQKDRVVVVGYFESYEGEDFKTFATTAEELRDSFHFGVAFGKELHTAIEPEAKEFPAVVIYKKFDDGKAVLNNIEESAILDFLNTESLPLLDQIGPENYPRYAESGLPLLFLFVSAKEDNTALFETFRGFAAKVKQEIRFCWIDTGKYSAQAGRLGLSGKVFPAVAIDEQESGQHFAYPEDKPVTEAEEWINQYVQGTLSPTIKSQDVPETNDGPVYVVVAKAFDEVVVQSNKDVFLEFYAPWCGHCKNLAPIYDALGESFKGVDSILIAKIDASANDVDPKYGVRGFPTLKFFPKGAKDTPLDFEGERTFEGMTAFIKQHSTSKVEGAAKVGEEEEGLKDEL